MQSIDQMNEALDAIYKLALELKAEKSLPKDVQNIVDEIFALARYKMNVTATTLED